MTTVAPTVSLTVVAVEIELSRLFNTHTGLAENCFIGIAVGRDDRGQVVRFGDDWLPISVLSEALARGTEPRIEVDRNYFLSTFQPESDWLAGKQFVSDQPGYVPPPQDSQDSQDSQDEPQDAQETS